MENKKLRVSTVLLILLIMVIIGLVVLLGIILVKINSPEKPKNVVANETNQIENVVNETNTTVQTKEKESVTIDNFTFQLDSRNKYRVTTDSIMLTMMNDGGSYTSVFYQIDLENNITCKVEEFHPSKLEKDQVAKKTKTIKKIDDNLNSEIRSVVNKVIMRTDSKSEGQYNYYILESLNREKKIYNQESIKDLRELLIKIDTFKGEEKVINE